MQSGQGTFSYGNGSRQAWNALAANLSLTPEAAIPVVRAMDASQLRDRIERLALSFDATKGDNVTWSATPRQNRRTGNLARVPVLIGSTANEGSFYAFGQPPATQQIFTEYNFQCPAKYVAEEGEAVGIPNWRYFFNATFANNLPGLGAFHTSEIPEVFGTYNQNGATQRQRDISRAMMKAWADFARDPAKGPGWAQVPRVEVFDGRDNQPVQYEVDPSVIDGDRCAVYLADYNQRFPV
jgi:carboxylesterase type B